MKSIHSLLLAKDKINNASTGAAWRAWLLGLWWIIDGEHGNFNQEENTFHIFVFHIHQEAAVHILHNFNFHNHQETTLHIIDEIHLEDEDGHLRDHHARRLRQQHCRSGLRSAQDGQKGASVMKKRQKSLFSRNSWTGLRTRTSDRPACQALVLVTMTSGCPQSQVLFFIFFVGDHIQDGVVDNDNDYHDDKKILRLGNDLVWWLHQQCAPRGRRQGKVTIFKSQFINYSNATLKEL